MTFKRILLITIAVALLLSATACRQRVSYSDGNNSTVALDDDPFFSAPDLIVRATADSIEHEFFTNPYGDLSENAHLTVFNLTLLEIYDGSLEEEESLPMRFQVKIFNGEGMSKELYLYGKDDDYVLDKKIEPFLLEIGKEYILGLSYLDEMYQKCYSSPGGYVIEMEKTWTFSLNEDGLYENLDTGVNHKEFDIPTLKEKIKELYELDPPKEVVPLYTVDESWKDPTITEEQREQFFEMVKEWRVDAMYEFTPEKPMELELFKYYCAYFVTDEEKTYVDMGVNYTGAAVERIAKRFGTSYGLKEDDQVFVKAGSLRDLPFAELIQYKEEQVDGKTLVTARCIEYSIPAYYYVDWDRVETMESYPTHKAMILAGEVTGYKSYTVFDFSFYTEDGKTPTQFVSFQDYGAQSLDEGYQTLPEFE